MSTTIPALIMQQAEASVPRLRPTPGRHVPRRAANIARARVGVKLCTHAVIDRLERQQRARLQLYRVVEPAPRSDRVLHIRHVAKEGAAANAPREGPHRDREPGDSAFWGEVLCAHPVLGIGVGFKSEAGAVGAGDGDGVGWDGTMRVDAASGEGCIGSGVCGGHGGGGGGPEEGDREEEEEVAEHCGRCE